MSDWDFEQGKISLRQQMNDYHTALCNADHPLWEKFFTEQRDNRKAELAELERVIGELKKIGIL